MSGWPHAVRRALPAPLESEVSATLAAWRAERRIERLWRRDASLWTGADEARWLGWLDVVERESAAADELVRLAAEVRAAGFRHALLMGMGGSSLCPEVLAATFGEQPGQPRLCVLDSTDPAQVRRLEERLQLDRTLFIVSSKSGTTLEPNVFQAYFHARAAAILGEREAGRRFVAITDPGSRLEELALRQGFRHVFHGEPGIGGRYSALSRFGTVPAAIMGLDVARFLRHAEAMQSACRSEAAPEENPGLMLGLVLGVLARRGLDKLTLIVSPEVYDLGAWLEQLVAESTGKAGRAIIPVDRESPAPPERYGSDRVFVYVRLESAPDAAQDAALEALERAGLPVVLLGVPSPEHLGGEFFRWEVATAVAGAVLGVHPFDQPDVEASKLATRRITADYEARGRLAEATPLLEDGGLRIFADPRNAQAVAAGAGGERSLSGWLRAHLARLGPGDYFALLAYLEMSPEHERLLQAIRHRVRDRKRAATCLGFGPRFLHSTGQAYKGGPNTGVFLQITCDDARDLPVPGQSYSFGVVKAAQAQGDLSVLAERGRRALRVHLPADTAAGLETLAEACEGALG